MKKHQIGYTLLLTFSLILNAWLYFQLATMRGSFSESEIRAREPVDQRAPFRIVKAGANSQKENIQVVDVSKLAVQRSSQIPSVGVESYYTPERRASMRAQKMLSYDAKFSQLFRELSLPAETLEKLKAVMVDRDLLALDLLREAQKQGGLSGKDFAELVKGQTVELDSQIASLLGDKLSTFKSYVATFPQRQSLAPLFDNIGYSSEPLSVAQQEELIAELAKEGRVRTIGGNAQVDWTPEFLTAAQKILTHGQQVVLNKVAGIRESAGADLPRPVGLTADDIKASDELSKKKFLAEHPELLLRNPKLNQSRNKP